MRSWNYKLLCGAVCLAQLACLSLPVWAAENTGPITAQTTMQEIRQDPSIAKSGIFTFGNADDGSALLRACFQNQTLAEYAGQEQAEDCAAALNLVAENYNAGRQVTYKVYTEEEIAATPAKAAVELYYFPAEQANAKFAVVLGGNIAFTSGELREGMASAAQLHDMGYGVFVLRYRIWMDMGDNAPLEDLARAVEYITAHAEELGVQPENYALVGFSSGGQLCGLFSSDKRYGYKAYDVPKPGALLMGYPVNDFAELKPVYHVLADLASYDWRYYWSDISGGITPDFPPTYFWYGKNDVTLKTLGYPFQGPAVRKALEANGVPCEVHVYENAPHAIGTGNGTDAEGWMTDAVAFWEQYTS